MVGKTNLTFISKGDASSVQLIQKSYVTGAAGNIYKMEVINNKFFIFIENKYVLTGSDFNNLDYIKKENEKMCATHIIYADEIYYVMDINNTYNVWGTNNENEINKPVIYMTKDFHNYAEIALKNTCMINDINNNTRRICLAGLFVDSRKNVIMVYTNEYSEGDWRKQKLYIATAKSMEEILEAEISCVEVSSNVSDAHKTFLMDNKLYLGKGWYSLAGKYTEASDIERYNYASGYFFFTSGTSLYRSRDGVSKILYGYVLPERNKDRAYVIPISGEIGFMYIDVEGNPCLNITDDVLKVGHVENKTIHLCDPITNIESIVEYDGKTYLGTKYGIIYELQLDYDGTIQRPDVTVIKTLSAKQALEQSLQYTDECIAKLRNYIDSKAQEQTATDEINSTGVES